SLAIKADGTLAAWGSSGSAAAPAGLSNVIAIAAGAYHDVAVTIDFKITALLLTGQDVVLRFHTFGGQRYSVEYSPDLSLRDWITLSGDTVQGNGYDVQVTDTNGAAMPQRFYRLIR